uniref:Transmembrane protein n=1 Tax=Macrostomum lignano TaxID=282301 RepID=A0A1I8IHV9_9PLAT
MHSTGIKQLTEPRPGYRRRAQQDIRLVRQYSLLLAVLLTSVLYRVLAVLVVQFMYLALHCESSVSSGYVITLCAENACFVCACLWSAGGATDNWLAGAVNRAVSPLLQAGSFGCLCANVAHFLATAAGRQPPCWPPYFTGLLWGLTWLNVASFATVAGLLTQLSSPLNLFDAIRQTDEDKGAPEENLLGRE